MASKILAHRGASAYAPENTMPSFELAIEQGADGVELDVHLTKDGELAVIHDERVDRTTDGKGFVNDFSMDELKKLDAKNGMDEFANARIPTLGEVYGLLARTKMTVNVEIKTDIMEYPHICDKLLVLEDKYRMNGRILYSSFNHYTMMEMLRLRPEARTGLLYMSIMASPWNYAQKQGAAALHPHFITFSKTPDMAVNCIRRGIDVNIWTVDDPIWIKRLSDLGVTSLITNKPDLARTTLLV